jgi:TetR/AcrR family transcriptional regulator, tetracycline repressor protein
VYGVLYTVHTVSQTQARNRLSRELILETALGLVRRDGLDSLSMRRLAQELDVWPMGIYRYFRDKDELVEALADAAADAVSPTGSGTWSEQVAALVRELRGAFRHHPDGVRSAGDVGGRAILEEAGLDRREATRAWNALLDYTAGSAAASGDQFDYGLTRLLDGIAARL